MRERKLVGSMLALARSLGLPAIAEGVATEEERDLLRDMGCVYAQGFLFARPLPPREAGTLIDRQLAPVAARAL